MFVGRVGEERNSRRDFRAVDFWLGVTLSSRS